MMNKDRWINKVQDVFAKGNLEATIYWSWTDSLGGIILLIGILVYLFSKIFNSSKIG